MRKQGTYKYTCDKSNSHCARHCANRDRSPLIGIIVTVPTVKLKETIQKGLRTCPRDKVNQSQNQNPSHLIPELVLFIKKNDLIIVLFLLPQTQVF